MAPPESLQLGVFILLYHKISLFAPALVHLLTYSPAFVTNKVKKSAKNSVHLSDRGLSRSP